MLRHPSPSHTRTRHTFRGFAAPISRIRDPKFVDSRSRAERLRALEASAGSWAYREFTGSEYVEALRGDMGDRLNRLILKRGS